MFGSVRFVLFVFMHSLFVNTGCSRTFTNCSRTDPKVPYHHSAHRRDPQFNIAHVGSTLQDRAPLARATLTSHSHHTCTALKPRTRGTRAVPTPAVRLLPCASHRQRPAYTRSLLLDNRHAKVLACELLHQLWILCTHELHELTVHPENHKLLKLGIS